MKLILASHGDFAKGIKHSLEMIAGAQESVHAFGLYEGEKVEGVVNAIDALLQDDAGEPVCILTDIFGGSVNNALLKYAMGDRVKVITGMNLALALNLVLKNVESISDEDIEAIVSESREGIVYLNALIQATREEVN